STPPWPRAARGVGCCASSHASIAGRMCATLESRSAEPARFSSNRCSAEGPRPRQRSPTASCWRRCRFSAICTRVRSGCWHVRSNHEFQQYPRKVRGVTSPAERYAAFRRRQRESATEFATFRDRLDFPLDDFQVRACEAVESGHGVLVAAPTGAGKTVVGEFAVHLGIATGRKAFYTTPIKALSNQKYLDLVAVHGRDHVGLLTGDTSINGNAPVVVMTTEVLRNMLYAGSDTLEGLGFVVMDEVHYLADRFRGPVWEEVIIHLDAAVQVVSLSATVSNAEEFGEWLTMVRGNTEVVVTENRPVPLWQHMMVGSRLLPLYSAHVDPTAVGADPPLNPD